MAMSAKPALPGDHILSAKQRAQQCTPGRFWKAVLWKLKPSSWEKIQPFPKSFSLSRKLRTLKEIVKELDKILPVVVRVHGDHHPELLEVAALCEELKASANAEIIRKLRTATNGFTAPVDACPTFEKTYRHMSSLAQELL